MVGGGAAEACKDAAGPFSGWVRVVGKAGAKADGGDGQGVVGLVIGLGSRLEAASEPRSITGIMDQDSHRVFGRFVACFRPLPGGIHVPRATPTGV